MPYPEIAGESSTNQAVKAYRGVAEAMSDHLKVEAFSLELGSPEHAIYESVFASTATHRKNASGEWGLAPPTDPNWHAAWVAMTDGFDHATDARVNLVEIARRLSVQSINVNDGIIRLFLIAGLLSRREDVVLYDNHNLVVSLDAAVAGRLSENIDAFSIKNSQVRDGQRKALLAILARRLQLTPNPDTSTLLAVVIALYRQFQAMPPYAQQTARSLSRDTLAIRQCFRGASEPDILIFETLPVILMIEPLTGPGRLSSVTAGEYTAGVFKAIRELQSAYPTLLRDIEQALAEAVASDGMPLPKLREDLVKKARRIADQELAEELATFVHAAASPGDDEQWLETIASMVTDGSPPRAWVDDAVERFRVNVGYLGSMLNDKLASLQ